MVRPKRDSVKLAQKAATSSASSKAKDADLETIAEHSDTSTQAAAHTTQQTTGARILVRALEDEGTEVVFGYPGGTVLEIYDALLASKKIKHVLVRHEQAAVHAAEGYARSARKPGVVLVTSGPGATNAVTGITNAYMDSQPLVVIAGQVATTAIGTDAFQEADFLGITLPVTKHSYLVKDASELEDAVHEAFYIANTGRRGPVVICVPSDIAKATAKYLCKASRKVSLASYKPTYKGNARQIKQAATLIREATRPVILSGGGVVASNADADLKALAELFEIPVAQSLMGRGSFPANHFLHLGQIGMHGVPPANLAVMGCDLLVAVGTRFSNRVTGAVSDFAPRAKVIHIDIDPAEIGKNLRVDVPIVGDAHEVLSELVVQLRKEDPRPQTEAWLEQIEEWRNECSIDDPEPDAELISAEQIIEAINNHLVGRDQDVLVATEVGEHQMWASRMLKDLGPGTFFTSGGAGTMGFGFPASMGLQIANPSKTVLCLAGDGSIQMNIQEMATCVQYGLPIKILVFNNAALGMIRQLQQVYYSARYTACDLPRTPDYELLAQAYGWQGRTVAAPAELDQAVAWLLDSEGSAILDVRMSHEELALPMVKNGKSLAHMIGAEGPGIPTKSRKGRR